ncbi:MAG: hypothetical protein ACI8XD_000044 [Thermoproteota archaeon]|jgi:hypothetical protein
MCSITASVESEGSTLDQQCLMAHPCFFGVTPVRHVRFFAGDTSATRPAGILATLIGLFMRGLMLVGLDQVRAQSGQIWCVSWARSKLNTTSRSAVGSAEKLVNLEAGHGYQVATNRLRKFRLSRLRTVQLLPRQRPSACRPGRAVKPAPVRRPAWWSRLGPGNAA